MKRRQFILGAIALTNAFSSGGAAQENMDSEEVFPPPPLEKIVSAIEDLKSLAAPHAAVPRENIFRAASEGIQDHYRRDEYESAGWMLHDLLTESALSYGVSKTADSYVKLKEMAADLQSRPDPKSRAARLDLFAPL